MLDVLPLLCRIHLCYGEKSSFGGCQMEAVQIHIHYATSQNTTYGAGSFNPSVFTFYYTTLFCSLGDSSIVGCL